MASKRPAPFADLRLTYRPNQLYQSITANRIPSASVPWSPPLFFPAHSRCAHTALRRPYKIEIGVSFAGKPALDAQQLPKKKTIAFSRDHPIAQWRNGLLKWENKKLRSVSAGEDFFYVTQGVSLGIADGVGGWSEDGVDPSLFSQALMYYASKHASSSWAGEPDFDPIEGTSKPEKSGQSLSPVDIMSLGYEDVLNDPSIECGSSTACIVNIDAQSGKLLAANLGDSSFSILRSSSIFHEQKPQTHYFNCPRQLAKLLPTQRPHLRITDRPEHADTFSTQLRHEDLIILSVHGLGDNVHPGEILALASLLRRGTADQPGVNFAQVFADKLVEYAVGCMFAYDKISPFELAAQDEGFKHVGGKIDDVTIVTARIVENI
ncbi:Stage II sporulation protein E (SpoIIE) [Rhizoctonia solani]|uniref:Protein phosphatase n=1 Tax=Rhizoctonia solani TaxID=456999 RepID=A0A8H7HAW4_9AGAM|nr:Stage II sporulation protein E (SpoIIE) [Rhizoctonia solani]